MAFYILTRFVLVKYSRAFVKRPSQGNSSLASQLTTVSLDANRNEFKDYIFMACTLSAKIAKFTTLENL